MFVFSARFVSDGKLTRFIFEEQTADERCNRSIIAETCLYLTYPIKMGETEVIVNNAIITLDTVSRILTVWFTLARNDTRMGKTAVINDTV